MANVTTLKLLNVPLRPDNKHTIYFENEIKQQEYFNKFVQHTVNNCTYQRKDNIMRVPVSVEYLQAYNINYVMYINKDEQQPLDKQGRYIYAFITEINYINEGVTELKIETDVIQTYLGRYKVMPSFIEREHVDDDTTGLHIVEEGLQTSEYVINSHQMAEYGGNEVEGTPYLYGINASIVVGVTEYPVLDGANLDFEKVSGTLYNGIYSGIKYYSFEHSYNGVKKLDTFLKNYANNGKNDAIVCMFLAPSKLAPVREDNVIVGNNLPDTLWINGEGEYSKDIIFYNTIDGYVPKNNKLLTFPYRYILTTNNSGTSVIYNFEDFYIKDGNGKTMINPKFYIKASLTPGCSIRLIPLNYKGTDVNDDEGINMGKYPILNWTSDVYTNWLTQNGVNIGISLTTGLLEIVSGGMSASAGNLLGGYAISQGVTTIANTLGEVHKMSKIPPQSAGNINCGDVVTSMGRNDFHFYEMSIKSESAKIIDDYFNMYGYKINRVKEPNTNHRKIWWYTKTIDANIKSLYGGVPNDHLDKIKAIYDNGITFWRSEYTYRNIDGTTNDLMYDYSQDNDIV